MDETDYWHEQLLTTLYVPLVKFIFYGNVEVHSIPVLLL